MAGIFKGSTEIVGVQKGSTEIVGVYKGSTEIWTSGLPDIVFNEPAPITSTAQWVSQANMTIQIFSNQLQFNNSSSTNDDAFTQYFDIENGQSYNVAVGTGTLSGFMTWRFQHETGGGWDAITGASGGFSANFTPTSNRGRLWLLPSNVAIRRYASVKVEKN